MNLLLLHPDDFAESPGDDGPVTGTVSVEGERLRHLRKVLRVEAGDHLRAGLLNGPLGEATVEHIDSGSAVLSVALGTDPPPPLDVALLLALPRPKFVGRILQNVSSMGVKEIVLFGSERVERSFWSSRVLEPAAVNRHLELGLEQGRDTVMPTVELVRRFGDLVERVGRCADGNVQETGGCGSQRAIWVAHADSRREFPREPPGSSTAVVGPEGGLLDHEIRALEEAGATVGSLGHRPLRVETAVSVCLGRLLPRTSN